VHILPIILPVFAIALLGYLLTWAGAFRLDDIPGLTRYVFNVALPIMLFDSMSEIALPETIRWSFLLAYYVPTILLYLGSLFASRRIFRYNLAESGLFAMGCSYSNTVLIGLPVITTAWGESVLIPLMMIIAIHAAVLFSITTVVVEAGNHRSVKDGRQVGLIVARTAVGMFRNPIVGGLAVGLAFNVFSIPVPATVATVTGWIRASALPAALFVTGASLRQYHLVGHLTQTATMVLVKLVVHPLLVWVVAAFVLRLPPLWTAAAVATAALPTGINASVFASKFDACVAPVTSSILITTALSIATLTVVLALFAPVL
jgi:malonate transporter and related proteins